MSNRIFKKINIDYILKNYFYLIVLLLNPLVLIIGSLYLIVPNYEGMKIQIQTAIDLENKYSELKINHIKKLKEYSDNFKTIPNSSLEKIKKILPYEKDIPVIINDINQISKNAGVEVEQITFEDGTNITNQEDDINIIQEIKKVGGLKKINFSLNIKNGKDFNTFKKFLTGLGTDIRLFNVNNFYVTSDFSKYTFNISCYYKDI